MENTTYSNIEKITDEAPRNIEHKELYNSYNCIYRNFKKAKNEMWYR